MEVMISMFLVSVAAVIVYTEMLTAYRMLTRSRARLESQNMAFDCIWNIYNEPASNLPLTGVSGWINQPTPDSCIISNNGIINCDVTVELNPTNSATVLYWEFFVSVWVPTNNPLQMGTNDLARYAVRRCNIPQ